MSSRLDDDPVFMLLSLCSGGYGWAVEAALSLSQLYVVRTSPAPVLFLPAPE